MRIVCLISVWLLVSLAEAGMLHWINKKEPELILNIQKYGLLLTLGNALLLVISCYKEGQSGMSAYWYFGLFTYLLCMTIYDLKFKELPDLWHLLLPVFYVILWFCGKQQVSFYESGMITVVLAAVLGLVFLLKREAIGIGDIKLILLCSVYAGSDCIGLVIRGMTLAFFVSIILLLFKKATAKSELPFVPFLLLGALFV